MATKSKTIEAEFLEFVCPDCKKGVYRDTCQHDEDSERWDDEQAVFTHPTFWNYRCSQCKSEGRLAGVYPRIHYKGKVFVLEEPTKAKHNALLALLRRWLGRERRP